MQGQCKPNAESSLYAEVQPVLAYRRQSYSDFRLIPNIPAYFSPTYNDNSTHRRQTDQVSSKLVAKKESFIIIWCFQELSLPLQHLS